MENIKELIIKRLFEVYPYAALPYIADKAEALLSCPEVLQTNIREWAHGAPLSAVKIRNKYTVGFVLKLRGSDDVPSAILSLRDYIENEKKEEMLWQTRK